MLAPSSETSFGLHSPSSPGCVDTRAGLPVGQPGGAAGGRAHPEREVQDRGRDDRGGAAEPRRRADHPDHAARVLQRLPDGDAAPNGAGVLRRDPDPGRRVPNRRRKQSHIAPSLHKLGVLAVGQQHATSQTSRILVLPMWLAQFLATVSREFSHQHAAVQHSLQVAAHRPEQARTDAASVIAQIAYQPSTRCWPSGAAT